MQKWAREQYQPCLPLGANHSRITECEAHRRLSYEAACEGAVLLKNDNCTLPLAKNKKIAVFGKAQTDYVKGGGGSGDVTVSYVRDIYAGLKLKKVDVFDRLSLFYRDYTDHALKNGGQNGMLEEPEIPPELFSAAREFTDTAIITINRYSGEGWDRKSDDNYFNLSGSERAMVELVCGGFAHVIVLLNVGAMIETSWFAANDRIGAAVLLWQGGMEGGLAAASVLTGDINPSGKLADTCAFAIDDYPSSAGFYESDDYVKYTEDIFVGYRYFETIPGAADRVVYPFGYGLSYTRFEMSGVRACDNGEKIFLSIDITNLGARAGKEVVQVYYSAPEGLITKPAKELCAFAKTKLLKPGETQSLTLSFDIADMASYDDTGAVAESAYVLEKGEYRIFVGNSIRNVTETDYRFRAAENRIVRRLTQYCAPERLGMRMNANGSYTAVPDTRRERKRFACDYSLAVKPDREYKLIEAANGETDLDTFIAQLSDEEMIHLVSGQPNRGVANTCGMGSLEKYGIPPVMTADGPAGVRIERGCGVNTTAFPVATLLACTWNTELVETIGRAGAREAKENNLSIWLTPALNIHRSPLCGRNFEYYSEDPLVSGKMAAAMVRGIQSQNVVAVPKHFACNNKETNRFESDSIVSERALREIYIKGFEICVREAKPGMIMTSYNIINGVRASENAELLSGILRGEWGYQGMLTTDWWNHASHSDEILAGNDIRMPVGDPENLRAALADGKITRAELAVCVKRILEMILWLE